MSDIKKHILIVDDEKDLLDMYRDLFEWEGFKVTTASSALSGLEAFKNNLDICLIISDSNMGELSGLDFLEMLKSKYQTIPVFYLSTGCILQTEEFIKSMGGHGLVLKPFDVDEIIIKIKKDLKL